MVLLDDNPHGAPPPAPASTARFGPPTARCACAAAYCPAPAGPVRVRPARARGAIVPLARATDPATRSDLLPYAAHHVYGIFAIKVQSNYLDRRPRPGNQLPFQYDVDKMGKLPVFVGFRGHSREYEETLTPGLYREHNGLSRAKWEKWRQCARVAGNVLKQRFLENESKPLTEIETIGILQHHYVIGPTDLLDFSYDVNIAKWFALNEHVHGVYRQKRFDSADRAADGRDASCVYTVAVRAIGILPLPEEHAHYATSGLTLTSWEDFGSMSPPAAAVPPWNLAPLWSKYPQRQKGFGVRGIGPGDIDEYGSVLSVAEYLFHPLFHRTGWERIGGPEMVIDGQRFTFDQDSSHMAKFLFPEVPTWFKEAVSEIEQIVKP